VIAQGTCTHAGAMGEMASQDLEPLVPLRLWQDLMLSGYANSFALSICAWSFNVRIGLIVLS